MQKIFKQNNLGYFDALILLVCSTICVWAILVKVNLIKVDVISQVSSIEKVAQIV